MNIDYKLVRKGNLKRIYLRVNSDSTIEVRACQNVPLKIIDEFIFSKSAWIKSRLKDIQSKNEIKIKRNGQLLYLGCYYPISLDRGYSNVKNSVYLVDQKIVVMSNLNSESNDILYDQFYKNEAKKIILPLVNDWARRMKLMPNKVSFRKNKTRWGSCSWQNNLSFNYLLIKLPVQIIEYIVVHELSHIKHKNHSKLFWSLVEEFLPDYIETKRILRNYEKSIF